MQIWDLESGGADGEPLHLVDDLDESPSSGDSRFTNISVGISAGADGQLYPNHRSAGIMRVWGMESETAVPEPLLTYRGEVMCAVWQ